jgi:hypothetical protein
MVCVPCIVIPLFLFLWHKFIQPFVVRYTTLFGLLDDGSSRVITRKKVGIFDVKIVTPKSKAVKCQGQETKEVDGNQNNGPLDQRLQEGATSSSTHSKID